MDQLFLQKLTEVIEANYSDPSFGAKNLERELGISHSNLLRKVRFFTGKPINQMITEIRMTRAWEMLQKEDLSISEVSSRAGFNSPSYFAASFRKHFGYPPGEARKMGQEGQKGQMGQEGQMDTGLKGFAQSAPPLPGAERTDPTPTPTPNRTPTPTPTPTSGVRWLKFKWVGAIIVIILAGIIISLAIRGNPGKDISIAVLPFRSLTQNANAGNISEILWEQVITTLAQIEVFDVRSAASSGQYRNTAKLVPKIGKELKVQYIIEGSVSLEGDQVKLWVQLINTKTDNHFWSEEYILNMSELNVKMLDMAEHVAYQLNTQLKPGERSAMRIRCSKSDESIENYLQGNYWASSLKGADPLRALSFYRKAIELDSTWAGPYVGIAQALHGLSFSNPKEEYLEECLWAARKAVEIRPDPNSRIALIRYYEFVGDDEKVRKLSRKLYHDYPDNPYVHLIRGVVCITFNRWKHAVKMLDKYLQANPESWEGYCALGSRHMLMRNFPEALSCYNRGISNNPRYFNNHYGLSEIALKWRGDTRQARDILEAAIKSNPSAGSVPLQPPYLRLLADIFDGRYEEALDGLTHWTIDVPGDHPPPNHFHSKPLYFAWVYGYQNKPQLAHAYYDSTRILLENRLKEFPFNQKRLEVISSLGMAYAGLGDTVRALEMAGRVGNTLSNNPDSFYGPIVLEDVAWIHAKTGNRREALKIIRKLLSKPGPLTAKLLEIDPKWSMLRDEPVFKRLIDRYTIEVVDVSAEVPEIVVKKPIVPKIKGPSFTDGRDGKTYHYKKIGAQVWMTENMAWLPAVSPPDTGSQTDKHYYVYGYAGTSVDEAKAADNYRAYGALYNWEAALTACPEGWHLPTDDEWKTLEKHLGMSEAEADYHLRRYSGAVGKKMKAKAGWPATGNGDNSARFYALPGGDHWVDKFVNQNKGAGWWTSTLTDYANAMVRAVFYDEDGVVRTFHDKRNGLSVRCVRD